MGIYRRLPDVYPIFLFFSSGRAEGFCAEVLLIHHTLGSREASMRFMTITILRVEPRAPLLESENTGVGVPGCTEEEYAPWYTRESIVGYIYTTWVYHHG